eukprot:m.62314 g.62314  ORF g.62314 m.62314 type:complete len:52 (-) comp11502_c0_seq2:158-313(-)
MSLCVTEAPKEYHELHPIGGDNKFGFVFLTAEARQNVNAHKNSTIIFLIMT